MDEAVHHTTTSASVIFPILLTCVAALVAYYLLSWLFTKTPKNLPPGPRGWRTNIDVFKASVDGTMHELASEWGRKYGPITFFYHLGHPMAFLNDPLFTRKLFASEEYRLLVADRIPSMAAQLAWYNGKDLVFSRYDAISKKKRRMLFKMLGVYGEGVQRFEQVVSGELDRLIEELDGLQNKDIDLPMYLGRSLKIIIYVLVVGERPPDITTPDILEAYDIAFNKLWAVDIDFVLTHLPILAKIPGKFKDSVDELLRHRSKAEEIMYHMPKRTWVPGKPRGIADLYLEQGSEPGNEWMANEEHGKAFFTSLFQTAHLTSRASLLGVFLCFMNYPNVVKKIQEEIDRILGKRRAKVEDRSIMHYTEATVYEVLRLVAQPLSSIRTAIVDVNIDGMTIPKGTVMFVNNWYFLHDERVWEDPWTFKPERFLDSEGVLVSADHPARRGMVSFGAGPRSCPGEVFARSRVFLFIATLLQHYDILPPVNEKPIPADFQLRHPEANGFIRQVQPYKCQIRRRQATAQ